jgi:hypothetical protein
MISPQQDSRQRTGVVFLAERNCYHGCGAERPSDAPSGLCPACLLKGGLLGDGSELHEMTITFGPASSSVLASFGEAFSTPTSSLTAGLTAALGAGLSIPNSSPTVGLTAALGAGLSTPTSSLTVGLTAALAPFARGAALPVSPACGLSATGQANRATSVPHGTMRTRLEYALNIAAITGFGASTASASFSD